MDEIKLALLKANYLEHFKFAKDLALILPIENLKRKEIEKELNKMQAEIKELTS